MQGGEGVIGVIDTAWPMARGLMSMKARRRSLS